MRLAQIVSMMAGLWLGGVAGAVQSGVAPGPGAQGGPTAPPLDSQPGDLDQFLTQGPQGRLAVRAVQGTADGPPIADVDVEIDLYHNNTPIKRIPARLDENGVVVIDEVPLAVGVRPVARIEYAGVSYLEAGPTMNAENPEAVLTVTAYETTDEAPAWEVAMRHVMVQPSAERVQVSETLVVENPGDRTWLGGPPDDEDRRTTVAIRLPEGAGDVHLHRGFHGWCCTARNGRELAVQMPLMPGKTTFNYAYTVPAESGQAGVRVGADAPTRSAVFIVPEGARVDAVGLEDAGVEQMGQTRTRMYQGQAIQKGQETGIVLAGLSRAPEPMSGSAGTARIAALVGGAAVLLGVAVLGVRSVARSRAQTS